MRNFKNFRHKKTRRENSPSYSGAVYKPISLFYLLGLEDSEGKLIINKKKER